MNSSGSLSGFEATVDARDSASVLRVLAALREGRERLLREDSMIFLECAGGTCPKDIAVLLGEWGYEAIARIPASNTLCFAHAKDVAKSARRESEGQPGNTKRAFAKELEARAKDVILNNRAYRSARNLVQEFRGLRPGSLRGRKLHKLLVSPDKFLEDSSYRLLSGPGLRVFQTLQPMQPTRPGARVARRRQVTVYDFPKRTVVVCFGPESQVDPSVLSACTSGMTLRTELIVVIASAHEHQTQALLSAIQCPRARLYIMNETSTEAMLKYGLARSYATNVALLSGATRGSIDDIDRAFSALTREADHFYDRELQMVGARRDVWRTYLAGQEDNSQIHDWVLEVANSGTSRLSDAEAATTASSASEYGCYPGVSSREPFAETPSSETRVTCYEKLTRWHRPPPPRWQGQVAKISVVMTVYNAADTVGAAIDSILAQSYSNVEVLVVDDCSTDSSLEVLSERAARDSRVRVLQTAQNSGTYTAKNIGLRFARGEFVTFHDSDDVSSLNRLEQQALALSADFDAIGNYTRYQRLSEEGNEVWLGGKTNRPGYITLMIRREAALRTVGYFDSVRVAADAEYVARLELASKRPVRLLPFVSYYALQAEGSLTTAGVAAFAVDEQGRTSMPPVREQYRDAFRNWHQNIYDGLSSGVMPFPLRSRPFAAPAEIQPRRGQEVPVV